MKTSEYYEADVLTFFGDKSWALPLYHTLFDRMEQVFPEAAVKVQKSQISFYGRHLFAAVSLPLRQKKTWPEECLVVTFGLGTRLDSSRIAVAVEPYSNRWTHHVLVSREEEIDPELLGWLQEAYTFSECK